VDWQEDYPSLVTGTGVNSHAPEERMAGWGGTDASTQLVAGGVEVCAANEKGLKKRGV